MKWDYETIARRYNEERERSAPFLPEVTAEEVKRDIATHRRQWLAQVKSRGHYLAGAYFGLKLYLFNPNVYRLEDTDWAKTPARRWLEGYSPQAKVDQSLPPWLLKTAKFHLPKATSLRRPSWARGVRDGLFSLWLLALGYQSHRTRWAIERIKKRWRIGQMGATPRSWFNWLKNQEEQVVAQLRVSFGWPDDYKHRFKWIREQFATYGFPNSQGWPEPLDERSTEGDEPHVSCYGLPIHDYIEDLKQLAWLFGGDPDNELWQDWVEKILWLPKPCSFLGSGVSRYLRPASLLYFMGEDNRKHIPLPLPPPTEPEVRGTAIKLPSRWVSLRQFPAQLRQPLQVEIIQKWGTYQEPPGEREVVGRLRSLFEAEKPDWDRLVARREKELEAKSAKPIEPLKIDHLVQDAIRKRKSRSRRRL